MDAEQLTRELALKATTALSNIIADYERGLISKAQAATGCRAVFDTVGGLIGGDVYALVSEAAQAYKGAAWEVLPRKAAHGEDYVHQCGTGKLYQATLRPIDIGQYNNDDPDAVVRRYLEAME